MEKRYTRRNPNGSYRIPAEGLGEFRTWWTSWGNMNPS